MKKLSLCIISCLHNRINCKMLYGHYTFRIENNLIGTFIFSNHSINWLNKILVCLPNNSCAIIIVYENCYLSKFPFYTYSHKSAYPLRSLNNPYTCSTNIGTGFQSRNKRKNVAITYIRTTTDNRRRAETVTATTICPKTDCRTVVLTNPISSYNSYRYKYNCNNHRT